MCIYLPPIISASLYSFALEPVSGLSFAHVLSLFLVPFFYAITLKEGIFPPPLSLLLQSHSDRGRVSIYFPPDHTSLSCVCLCVYLYVCLSFFSCLLKRAWSCNTDSALCSHFIKDSKHDCLFLSSF